MSLDAALPSERNAFQGGEGLASRTYAGLLLTQFFTALNDNLFRWLVIGIGKDYYPENPAFVLMVGTACFVLPYLFLAAPAGYFADRFSKRTVILWCKWAELAILILGTLAIVLGSFWLLIGVVLLLGAQSSLFAPARFGSLPELLKPESISAANGWFGFATVGATVMGMAGGSYLYDVAGYKGMEHWYIPGAAVIGVALAGLATSYLIRGVPAGDPGRSFPWLAIHATVAELKTLAAKPSLLKVAIGIAFFWAIGALAVNNIDQFTMESGGLHESDKTPLLLCLTVGLAVGSVLSGILSGDHVELGLLPIGLCGIAIFSTLLFFVPPQLFEPGDSLTGGLIWAGGLLFFLGVSAGMFDVPLEAYLQRRSDPDRRGAVLAASNFLTFAGILLTSIVFFVMRAPLPGDIARIPDEHRGLPLSSEDARSLDRLLARHESEWQSSAKLLSLAKANGEQSQLEQKDLGNLRELTRDLPDSLRREALVQLVAADIEQRQERKLPFTPGFYFSLSPDDRFLIREAFDQAVGPPLLSTREVFLVVGVVATPAMAYVIWLIPQTTIRFLVWLAVHSVYRVRVVNRKYLPDHGGAVLVCNHVSWLDGFLLLLVTSRRVRMVVFSGNFAGDLLTRWARWWGTILLDAKRPKEVVAALREARGALNNGELVGLFPEGGISRTGQILSFKPGLMKILEGTEAPVIPVYLHGLWGSVFSFSGGKFFWKWPRRWPYPVTIYFGPPIEKPKDVHEVRRAVQDLGAHAMTEKPETQSLEERFIRMCKKRLRTRKVADILSGEMTGGQLLMRTLILRRLLRRHVLEENEKYVGLLLPSSVVGLVANLAVALDRRVAVNLNTTVTCETLNYCIREAGIKHVLTSRKVMEKLSEREPMNLDCEVVFMEDFREDPAKGPTTADKLAGAVGAFVTPARVLSKQLGLDKIGLDDEVCLVFTSGSTGKPKGVMLTHRNIAHNVEGISQVVHLRKEDVLVGILPFFHSMGSTVTIWGTATLDIAGVYHISPLDAKQVGKVIHRYGGTIIVATPTFLRMYLARCTPDQLKTLDVVVAGAEKLPEDLAEAFEKKFGVRPVEGYGATELSPLVSVNVPPSRSIDQFQVDRKEGTVGRPVPGVTAKILDLETERELSANEPGMLWIKGPNVMKGYLNRPEQTSEVIHDGWYKTGDVAYLDEDGFIKITGRISRFSKIGGEMVPHLLIEESIEKILGSQESGALQVAVTAIPHPTKGERLIVLHTPLSKSVEEIRRELAAMGLPNIFIPGAESWLETSEIPVLGTGKLDLSELKKRALEAFSGSEAKA
ncbi:MAG TPA: MFS transporter [Pirellulaceae bacterium]|jgi:1-acyl-sn-glycerol-3-phosphate acyltransferase|nr:MFS transporter [Pirellulaceae bacterium]